MTRFLLSSSFFPALLMALMLGALVIAVPIVNSASRLPKSVFLILPEEVEPPRVALNATPLGNGRYRISLDADDFQFTETCVASAERLPIGHAHIHVDGKKVASAYQPIVEIGPLAPGEHVIDAVLRGQDHRALVAQDKLVRGILQISVPAGPA